MNNLVQFPSKQDQTMSSREIAELTGKEHKNVFRDCRKVFTELDLDWLNFERTYKDGSNRNQSEIILDKEMTLTIVSGYSVKLRHQIIKRWQELESQQAARLPTTYIEALQALVESEQQKQILIETKAEIGSRREATAMNTASQQAKRANKLEIELDRSQEYATVKRVSMLYHGQKFSWRELKSAAAEMDLPAIDVFDANYGTVKAYHADVWLEVYALSLTA